MANQKYDFEIDLSNRDNCHTLMVEMIGSNKRVLEVGCATGYMSRVLSERGCEVIGVEIDEGAAERAREHCSKVLIGNIEELDLSTEVGDQGLDVVVFGDVLEHLTDPLSTLRSVRPWIRRDGYVVASVPNIAHGAVRLALLKGRFDYNKLGLLDETHIRFFTKDGVTRLFSDAGFGVSRIERTTAPLFGTEIQVSPEEFDERVVEEVLDDPESTTYQFVVQAVLHNADRAAQELLAELEELRMQHHRLRRIHEGAAAALDEARVMLEELPQRRGEVEGLRREIEVHLATIRSLDQDRVTRELELQAHRQRWARLQRLPGYRLFRALRRLLRTDD